jgi:hypothetical protein
LGLGGSQKGVFANFHGLQIENWVPERIKNQPQNNEIHAGLEISHPIATIMIKRANQCTWNEGVLQVGLADRCEPHTHEGKTGHLRKKSPKNKSQGLKSLYGV